MSTKNQQKIVKFGKQKTAAKKKDNKKMMNKKQINTIRWIEDWWYKTTWQTKITDENNLQKSIISLIQSINKMKCRNTEEISEIKFNI